MAQPGLTTTIESRTGAEPLGIGQPSTRTVRVAGYPGTQDQPISCQNRTSAFTSHQPQFECDGYTDGTSGSPFLIRVNPATAAGTVIGVIVDWIWNGTAFAGS